MTGRAPSASADSRRTIRLDYDPPGATLRAFRASPAANRALIGPILGGRKTCVAHDIVIRAGRNRQPRWRWLAVSPTIDQLYAHLLPSWQHWVRAGHLDDKSLVHHIELGLGDRAVRELEIVFLGLDRPEHRRRLGHAEASGVWLDEARDLPETALDDALRAAGAWPLALPDGSLPWGGVVCTSRMPRSDHWLMHRPELTLFRQPGGRNAEAENLANLRPGYYQRLAETRDADWVHAHVDAHCPVPPELAAQAAAARDRIARIMGRLASEDREMETAA